MDSFVYYTIMYSNERQSRITKTKVKEGDDIDSIIDQIKLKESPDFDPVPASRIELFERADSAEPLHALAKWYPDVTWGKPETPLIVRVQPRTVASWNHNEVAQGAVVSEERDGLLLQVRLGNGTFFSSLGEVWSSGHERFENHESFVRDRHVADAQNQYKLTVIAARIGSLKAAENSVRSSPTTEKVDIFGLRSYSAHSAHLLPQSPSCSPFWFPVVPLVLNTENNNLTWTFLQKCIHGSLTGETNETNKGFFRRLFSAKSRNDVKKTSARRNNSSNRSNSSRQSRIGHSGIKHFSTNRIRLVEQKTYFDAFPCVIIVPIMTVEAARLWNEGDEYDAIVLAGDWETDSIEAATVYQDIKASHNMLEHNILSNSCLASEDECSTACHLLKQMILCVCESAKGSTHLFIGLNTSKYEKFNEWNSAVRDLEEAPVPISNRWGNGSDAMKVRKIAFSTTNPAPDPVLLLAKATSNWLKRHQIGILPACGDDDSSNSDSSNSSDLCTSRSGEAEIRGWSHLFAAAKKPRIAEVDVRVNRDTVDEPLSDDE